MIVHHEDATIPPACWNRDPRPASYTRYGIDSQTGHTVPLAIRMDWAEPGCQSWAPGIGQPALEYPSGTPYPVAIGFAAWCQNCKWMPEGKQ